VERLFSCACLLEVSCLAAISKIDVKSWLNHKSKSW